MIQKNKYLEQNFDHKSDELDKIINEYCKKISALKDFINYHDVSHKKNCGIKK